MRKRRTPVPPTTANGYASSASSKTPESRTETDAALEAGEELARAKFVGQALRIDGGRPYRVTEDDKIVSLEGFLPRPVTRRGEIKVYDPPSFVGYVNRFQNDASVIFVDKVGTTLTAVLDYHEGDKDGRPDWCRHRVVLALRPTRQWLLWTGQNKQGMTQAAFAAFMEENIPDIIDPPGATIVEMARTLQAKKDVAFESNILRQTDGSFKFFYSENVQGATHRADLKIPELFTLLLTPFENSSQYSVVARFRFRLGDGGKLTLSYELVRLEDVLEDAFQKAAEHIAEGVDGTFIVNGPAPAQLTTE